MSEHRIVRRSAGLDEYAHVKVGVTPLSNDSGNVVRWHAGADIPSRFVDFVLAGAGAALEKGVVGGIAFVGVRATVESGSYHEADSNGPAFREAAEHATFNALQRAQPQVLEANLVLNTSVPEEYIGVVVGLLEAHDEVLQSMEPEGGIVSVTAKFVWSKAQRFMSDVMNNTQSGARFSFRILDFVKIESEPQPPEEWASLT